MKKRIKIGLIGAGITTVIAVILAVAKISPVFVAPFFLPWMALILIGITDKKRK